MATKGIDLEIDSTGEVKTVEEPDGELCSGIVVCPNCENRFCSVDKKNWADIDCCPLNKWTTIWYGEESPPPHQYPKDSCHVCGGKKFWKSEAGPVVCETCHPPMACASNIEQLDVAGAIVQKSEPPKKKEKAKRSVKVVKRPAKQSKFFS